MTALVAWVWQGAVVAAAAALLVQVVPRLNAATKHAIWWIAAVMVVVHPWTPSVVPSDSFLATAGAAAAGDVLLVLPPPPAWVVTTVLTVWLLGVGAGLVQVIRGVRFVRDLKQGARPFDPKRERRLRMWSSVQGTGRRPSLRLSDEELDLIVMHEHAHLTRYDDWTRLLQCLVTSFVGLHPVLWVIGRQIDLERESACDDHVVARTGAPREYAACLTLAASVALGPAPRRSALMPAATGSAAALRLRIIRLLDVRADRTPRLRLIAGAARSLALAVVGSDHIPPLVAFMRVHATKPEMLAESRAIPMLATHVLASPETVGPPHAGGRARSRGVGRVLHILRADAARTAGAIADQARGLTQAASTSFMTAGSRVAKTF